MRSGPTAPGHAPSTSGQRRPADMGGSSHVYVYGILPGDAEVDGGLLGVGDPPGQVRMLRHGDLGALISEVGSDWSLGSPRDMTVHKQILDASASQVPVLPLRFGSTVADAKAVVEHLLAANRDLFAAALRDLQGRIQYVIKGRYQEDAILREVLAQNREAARLRNLLRSAGDGRMAQARLRLGEIVGRTIDAKREHDTRLLAGRLAGLCEASIIRAPQHERDAAQIAVLVRTSQFPALQEVVSDQAARWRERVDLRLLGPMAAYDFVVTTSTGGA
jgi:Gas vesicle synthesis protein GvpL/GvpF